MAENDKSHLDRLNSEVGAWRADYLTLRQKLGPIGAGVALALLGMILAWLNWRTLKELPGVEHATRVVGEWLRPKPTPSILVGRWWGEYKADKGRLTDMTLVFAPEGGFTSQYTVLAFQGLPVTHSKCEGGYRFDGKQLTMDYQTCRVCEAANSCMRPIVSDPRALPVDAKLEFNGSNSFVYKDELGEAKFMRQLP